MADLHILAKKPVSTLFALWCGSMFLPGVWVTIFQSAPALNDYRWLPLWLGLLLLSTLVGVSVVHMIARQIIDASARIALLSCVAVSALIVLFVSGFWYSLGSSILLAMMALLSSMTCAALILCAVAFSPEGRGR